MKEEGKTKSTPLYSNPRKTARDLGITRSTTKAKVQSTVITPDRKVTKVTTHNSFAALPTDLVTTAEVTLGPKITAKEKKRRKTKRRRNTRE